MISGGRWPRAGGSGPTAERPPRPRRAPVHRRCPAPSIRRTSGPGSGPPSPRRPPRTAPRRPYRPVRAARSWLGRPKRLRDRVGRAREPSPGTPNRHRRLPPPAPTGKRHPRRPHTPGRPPPDGRSSPRFLGWASPGRPQRRRWVGPPPEPGARWRRQTPAPGWRPAGVPSPAAGWPPGGRGNRRPSPPRSCERLLPNPNGRTDWPKGRKDPTRRPPARAGWPPPPPRCPPEGPNRPPPVPARPAGARPVRPVERWRARRGTADHGPGRPGAGPRKGAQS